MTRLEIQFAALATWMIQHWRRSLVFAVVVSVAALSQLQRIQFDDDFRNLFRATGAPVVAHQRNDLTCVAMIYGSPLITSDGLKIIHDVHRRLQALACVEDVNSMLDARQPRRIGRYFLPHFPGPEARPDRIQESAATAVGHPLLDGQLLTADQTATLLFVRLRADIEARSEIRDAVTQVRQAFESALEGTNLQFALTGMPVIRLALADVFMRDQTAFVVGGATVAWLISILVFRSLLATLIILAGPLLGVLWTMAALAVGGEPLNIVNGMVSPLALALGLTSAVHMMYHYRRQRSAGADVQDAVHSMIRIVVPACGWAALTTILGFLTLGVARLETIRHMGFVCAAAVALTSVAVLTTLPALCLLVRLDFGRSPGLADAPAVVPARNRLMDVACHVLDHPRRYVALGMSMSLGMLAIATQLNPTIGVAEALPSSSDTLATVQLVEQRFGGVLPITLVVRWPETATGAEVLETIVAAHEALEGRPFMSRPMSLVSLLRSLPGETIGQQRRQLRHVPKAIIDRFLDGENRQSSIFVRCADATTSTLEPVIRDIEDQLRGIESAHSGFTLTLTEVVVDAVGIGNGMITDLANSLLCAIPLIALVLIFTFQSWRLGLVSIVPNVFPLAATAACIVLLGWHLRLFTVSLFAIFFGIAVDDTIHIMLRFRREVAGGASVRAATLEALQKVGPAVMTTTLVLSAGMSVLLISEVFGIRRFGFLFCCGLFWALIGDLILLPACLVWLLRDPDRSASEKASDSDQRESQA